MKSLKLTEWETSDINDALEVGGRDAAFEMYWQFLSSAWLSLAARGQARLLLLALAEALAASAADEVLAVVTSEQEKKAALTRACLDPYKVTAGFTAWDIR